MNTILSIKKTGKPFCKEDTLIVDDEERIKENVEKESGEGIPFSLFDSNLVEVFVNKVIK